MMLQFRLFLAIFLLSLTFQAQTAIFSLNDLSLAGSADGFNITRDTTNGLEWLDLDLSVGRTYADLTGADGSNEFIAGGDFEGFRYATLLELAGDAPGGQIDSLYKSLGISPVNFSSTGGYAKARALIEIIGCFSKCAEGYGYSNGIILSKDGTTEDEASMIAFQSFPGGNWGRSELLGSIIVAFPNDPQFPYEPGETPYMGNWLVRDISEVPLPAGVWLFGSALGLLGLIRRKTNRR